jgi:uncharacterized protein (TIRG00374 family)
MRLDRRTAARAALGLGVSAVAVYFLLRSVDLAATADVLRRAELGWIGLMLVTVLLDVAARALRWRRLLAPISPVPYRRVLGYTFVGYLANNVLPARLGELVRSHALGEREGLSRTTVLGTVVVERIVDTAMVVGMAAISILTLSVQGTMTTAVVLGVGFVGILIVGLAVLIVGDRLPGAARAATILSRWPRLLELAGRLREGLAVAGSPRTIAAAVGIGALAWAASIATFLLAGKAVGIDLSVAQAALLCTGVALATIVPSGPGYLGTFELTAVGIAGGFGIGPDEAFAMALLVHAMILGVTSIGGVVSVVRLGLGLRAGSTEMERGESAASAAGARTSR